MIENQPTKCIKVLGIVEYYTQMFTMLILMANGLPDGLQKDLDTETRMLFSSNTNH